MVTVVGSYPRVPHEGREFLLRRATEEHQSGRISDAELRQVQDEVVREVLREQAEVGVELATDGGVRWDDPQTAFAGRLAGVRLDGLVRYFDNNVYFRQPVVEGPLEWRGPVLVEDFIFARRESPVAVKAVLVGPFTLACLSQDLFYGDLRELTLAYARALHSEVVELERAGAGVIQVDEPSLLRSPEQLPLVREALEVVFGGVSATTACCTFFGDASRLGPDLFELPVRFIGLDLVSGPRGWELLEAVPPEKGVALGLVDARNTRLEREEEVAEAIERAVGVIGEERVWVNPSAGLEFLPREKAREKLALLARAAARVRGRGG